MNQLVLPPDPAAERLLAGLDAGYQSFARQLPPGLRPVATCRRTFTGDRSTERFTGPSGMNPGLTCTPWMFWEETHRLDEARFLGLAVAGSLLVLASVLLDHLVDGQVEDEAEVMLLHESLCAAGERQLRAWIPARSPFWVHADRLRAEHLAGLSAEASARAHPAEFTPSTFREMVPGKFAPIVITMAGFAASLRHNDLMWKAEASIKHLAIASQLLDDLGDWKQDLAEHRLTFFLAQQEPPEAWEETAWPPPGALTRRIGETWSDVASLREVIGWLDAAQQDVASLVCPAWIAYLAQYRELAESHLLGAQARHLVRSLGPLARDSVPLGA